MSTRFPILSARAPILDLLYNPRMTTYLAKVGELTLKGSNIKMFERQLVDNAREALGKIESTVALRAGRLYIECADESTERAEFALDRLIGATGWAKARVCAKDIGAISSAAYDEALEAKKRGARTFKMEARRQDKSFALSSYEICCQAAEKISDDGVLAVDVHNPDARITVEVRDKCYVFSDARKSPRGLPVGCSGKGLLLLSGGLDSPVAGYRMLRRGMEIDCAYFHSYPYTSDEARQKVVALATILAGYGLGINLTTVPFTDVQMRIKEKAPEDWTTLMLRVCMMKAANVIAERGKARCIITGESLGQVASQTLANLRATESFARLPLFRPLIAFDKEEITREARAIGTYDTSILPYEDCCVLFAPKHPVLNARAEDAMRIFDSLGVDDLLRKSVDDAETVALTFEEAASLSSRSQRQG